MFRRHRGGGVVFIDALFVRLDSAKRLQSISGESQLEFVALAPRRAATAQFAAAALLLWNIDKFVFCTVWCLLASVYRAMQPA